jgi:hypothetical protein
MMAAETVAFPDDHQDAGSLDLVRPSFKLSTTVLPGISPFVETPGNAALTKPLAFMKLCLDAGLPLSCTNLIEQVQWQ